MTRQLPTDARQTRRTVVLLGAVLLFIGLIVLIPRPSAEMVPNLTDSTKDQSSPATLTSTGTVSAVTDDSVTVLDGPDQSIFRLNGATTYQRLTGTAQKLELRSATRQDLVASERVAIIFTPDNTPGQQIALIVQMMEVQ